MAIKTQEEELQELNALFPSEELPPRDELARLIQAQASDLCRNFDSVKDWYSQANNTLNGCKLSECLDPDRAMRSFFTNLENLIHSLEDGPFNEKTQTLIQYTFSRVSQLLLSIDSLPLPKITYSIKAVNKAWGVISPTLLDYLFEPKTNRKNAVKRYLRIVEKLRSELSRLALDLEYEERKLSRTHPNASVQSDCPNSNETSRPSQSLKKRTRRYLSLPRGDEYYTDILNLSHSTITRFKRQDTPFGIYFVWLAKRKMPKADKEVRLEKFGELFKDHKKLMSGQEITVEYIDACMNKEAWFDPKEEKYKLSYA